MNKPKEKAGAPTPEINSKAVRELRAAMNTLAFYKFVVDSVPSGVITVDRDLRITNFNPWAERLTGYRAEEAIGILFECHCEPEGRGNPHPVEIASSHGASQ